jgi:hypothetical protein
MDVPTPPATGRRQVNPRGDVSSSAAAAAHPSSYIAFEALKSFSAGGLRSRGAVVAPS